MKKNILSIFAFITLFLFTGCGSVNFNINTLDDKFTNEPGIYKIIGDNNKLSNKSSQGGIHIDYQGLYIDPVMSIDTLHRKLIDIQFFIHHHNFPNGEFYPIKTVIFITDTGERIMLNPTALSSSFDIGSWNSVNKSYYSSISEYSFVKISYKDYLAIVNSKWVEIKIIGTKIEQIYDKDDILPSFLINLKKYHNYTYKFFDNL